MSIINSLEQLQWSQDKSLSFQPWGLLTLAQLVTTISALLFNIWLLSGRYQTPMQANMMPTYPYGGGGDLEVVQPAQGALPVGEVGGSQLVEGLQGHCPRRVWAPAAATASLGPRGRGRLLAELPLVHKYGQRLLPCRQSGGGQEELH